MSNTKGGKRPGAGGVLKGDAVMVPMSHRMTPTHWKAFKRWGGVDRLRKTMGMFLRAEKGEKTKAAKG